MQIHLYNHRGDHIADSFEIDLPSIPAVGDFIRRPHPGFELELRNWIVVGVVHDLTTEFPGAVIEAWEIPPERGQEEMKRRYQLYSGNSQS